MVWKQDWSLRTHPTAWHSWDSRESRTVCAQSLYLNVNLSLHTGNSVDSEMTRMSSGERKPGVHTQVLGSHQMQEGGL